MKKFSLIVCVFAIVFSSCKNNKLVDVTVLPEQTQVGANTFGCLVDGYIYAGGRYADHLNGIERDHNSINFKYDTAAKTMNVIVKVQEDKNTHIKFTINGVEKNVASQDCIFSNARFSQGYEDIGVVNLDNSGTVKITKMNYPEHIISGIFYGTRITEGRFDVHFE